MSDWNKDVLLAENQMLIEKQLITINELTEENEKLKQRLACYEDEIKNRGTCGLCEKLENKEINELKQLLAEKEQMILFLESQLSDFNVDITKTFANWDNKQRDKIKELEDKNKELEILADTLSKNQIQNLNRDKELCHKICDKIRKWLQSKTVTKYVVGKKHIFKLLDQIEKGEE